MEETGSRSGRRAGSARPAAGSRIWPATGVRDPPPQYGPPQQYPPQYGQPQYAPPPGYQPPAYGYPPYGSPANPYGAPLPQRGGIGRWVWVIVIGGLLVLGSCGVGGYFLFRTLSRNADEVNAFLADVHDRDWPAAYQHLCPDQQAALTEARFTTEFAAAVAQGHRVSSYDITSTETNSTNGVTTRTAGGTVTFADGTTRYVTFTLNNPSSGLCISFGYQQLR